MVDLFVPELVQLLARGVLDFLQLEPVFRKGISHQNLSQLFNFRVCHGISPEAIELQDLMPYMSQVSDIYIYVYCKSY